MLSLLAALLLAAPAGAQPPASARGATQLGDVSLVPPPGFAPDPDLGQGHSAALAIVAGEGDPERRLVGLFKSDGADPATLALSTVDAPLALEPGSKAPLAAAVAGHFKRTLALAFTLERTSSLPGRVEVWGTLAVEGAPREVAVAFYPGAHSYAVAVASMPAARAEALRADVEASLASVQLHQPPEPLAQRRTLISIVVWGAAAVALLLARLWRRRSREGDSVQGNV